MLSDRALIETDKSYLRRTYAPDAAGLLELKKYAIKLYDECPQDVEITTTTKEGVSGGGQISNNLRIRRIAVEELISERDPNYIAPLGQGFVQQFTQGRQGFGL